MSVNLKKRRKKIKKDFGIDIIKPGIRPLAEILNDVPAFILAKVEVNCSLMIDKINMTVKKDSILGMPYGIYQQIQKDKQGTRIFSPYRHKFEEYYRKFNINDDLNGKKVLIVRSGGIGDIIFTQSVIKQIKERYPKCEINYATSPGYMTTFYMFPQTLVNSVTPIPFTLEMMKQHDYHLFFMGVIENSKEAEEINCYDLFSKAAGMEFDPKYNPEIVINNNMKNEYLMKHPMNYKNMVVIQPRSSSIIRSMTGDLLRDLINKLIQKGYTIGLIDSKDSAMMIQQMIQELRVDSSKVVNLAAICPTIVHGATVISLSKGAITVDSAFSHIAAGLGKPIISIFGAFKGDIRMKYYPTGDFVEPTEGWNECGNCPCFYHTDRLLQCPYVSKREQVGCMTTAAINVDLVVEKFEEKSKEVYGN